MEYNDYEMNPKTTNVLELIVMILMVALLVMTEIALFSDMFIGVK